VDESDIGKVYPGQPARIKVGIVQGQDVYRQGNQDFSDGVRRITSPRLKCGFDSESGRRVEAEMTANAELFLRNTRT